MDTDVTITRGSRGPLHLPPHAGLDGKPAPPATTFRSLFLPALRLTGITGEVAMFYSCRLCHRPTNLWLDFCDACARSDEEPVRRQHGRRVASPPKEEAEESALLPFRPKET